MTILEVPSYPWGVLKQLQALQADNTLCDVRLTCETGGISAHKLVLMAASPYLKTRISLAQTREQDLIHFDNTSLEMLERVVKYLYTGKLEIDDNEVESCMKFCTDLELDSAVDACKLYLKIVDENEFDAENVVTVKEEADDASELDVSKQKENLRNRRVQRMPRKRVKIEDICDVEDEIVPVPVKRSRGRPPTKVKSVDTIKARHRGRAKKSESSASKVKPLKLSSVKAKAAKKESKGRTAKKENKKQNEKENEDREAEESPEENAVAETSEVSVVINDIEETGDKEISENAHVEDGHDDDDDDDDDDGGGGGKISESDHESDHFDHSTDDEVVETEEKTEAVKGKKRGRKPVGKSGERSYIKVRRRKSFPCTSCSRVLSSHKRLVFHEYSKHGVSFDQTQYTMVPCKEEGCSYVAANRHNLDTHMKSRHGVERPHICEFCGKAFKLPNVLATHLNIHTGKKIWKCETCGENFNQQSGLDIHVKRHHIGISSWGELCHLCSEKFLQKSELAWHLFKYHDMPLPEKYKAYICDICNYLTKSSQDLERHANAHKGIKQHTCPVCQKSCSTKSELKRHVSFHGEKKFKCTFEGCSYACTDSIGLGKHIKLMHTHRHIKPYVCPVCPYKTGVKGNLDKHIRQVHNLIVVTKHTVALKMKYSMFESGDVITQEGRLIATARERKELEKNPELCVQQREDVKAAVRESVQAAHAIDSKSSSSTDMTMTPLSEKAENMYHHQHHQTVPLDLNASHADSVASPVGNHIHPMVPHTETMPPISSIGNYGCMQDGVMVPSSSMAVPQDLRMSLGNQPMPSNMYHDMGPGNGPLYISQQ